MQIVFLLVLLSGVGLVSAFSGGVGEPIILGDGGDEVRKRQQAMSRRSIPKAECTEGYTIQVNRFYYSINGRLRETRPTPFGFIAFKDVCTLPVEEAFLRTYPAHPSVGWMVPRGSSRIVFDEAPNLKVSKVTASSDADFKVCAYVALNVTGAVHDVCTFYFHHDLLKPEVPGTATYTGKGEVGRCELDLNVQCAP